MDAGAASEDGSNAAGDQRTRAVFLDLAGTLIEVRNGLGAQYAAVASEFGIHAEPAEIDRAFPSAFTSAGPMVFPRTGAVEAASLEKGFWKEVVRRVLIDVPDADTLLKKTTFDRYFERLFDHFTTAAAWTVFADVVPAIEQLKREGLVVGLITNFDYRVFPLIDALDLTRHFDSITIPAIAGAAKPDGGIFECALERHGVRASEAVQVGDSMKDDVEGARAAGLKGVLLDRKGRHNGTGAVTVIRSLAELPGLLSAR